MQPRTFHAAQCHLQVDPTFVPGFPPHHNDDAAASSGTVTLRYWTSPADSASQRTGTSRILLVHGFRGDHHGMEAIAQTLPGFDVVIPDLPAFGMTEPVRSPSGAMMRHDAALYAAVLEALTDELEFGPNDLVLGHSFGSVAVAMHAAHTRRRMAGVCLLAPITAALDSAVQEPAAAAVDLFYRGAARLPAPLTRKIYDATAVQHVMNRSMTVSGDPAVHSYIRDQHARYFNGYYSSTTLLDAYRSSSADTVSQYSAQICAPVLLIAGTQDPLISASGCHELYDTFHDAELHIIGGTGHLLHYETPADVGAALTDFITSRLYDLPSS